MPKRVLLCLSHSVEEYDQLRLLHSLGYEVASIGGYVDPARPHDPKRPALPEVPFYPEVRDAIDAIGSSDNLGDAQSHIPERILEWLGADGIIIFHHYLSQRLFPQWEHLREWRQGGGRIVWRTVGQSVEANEREAKTYREDGLEIVRYSPKERLIPGFAGEDALIRFYKDPEEWKGWSGDARKVVNVTQHLAQRDPWTNYRFWREATEGLPSLLVGPGSDEVGGTGQLTEEGMRDMLREARCYLYTGTQPASYTLGLVEALMVGIPTVSIGPQWMTVFPYGPDLFEAHELCGAWSDVPAGARLILMQLLENDELAQLFSREQRRRARETFGMDVVGRAWSAYLGAP